MKYFCLVGLYQQLEATTKRLEKTYLLAEFFKKHYAEIEPLILLVQGRVFPSWAEEKTGIAARLAIRAISLSCGLPSSEIENAWGKIGDLGEVCAGLVAKKKQMTIFSEELKLAKVYSNLQKLAVVEGDGATDRKIGLIAELLTSANPAEAKYIIRSVLEELRIGIGEGIMRDAIAWAFIFQRIPYNPGGNEILLDVVSREDYNKIVEIVQEAYNITNDFSRVAMVAQVAGVAGLADISIEPGRPLKVMLFQKAQGIKDAFERVGKPCALEYKMDGFRMQIHKFNSKVLIFTRRLENVTQQFPDVVACVQKNVAGENFVFDAEAVGFDTASRKYLPFQSISQRIKRKHGIHEMAKKFPVELNVFDIVYYNGKTLVKTRFSERRAILERIITPAERQIVVVKQFITQDINEASLFYKESLACGNEGIMAKNLEAVYAPGSRVGYGVKIKPVMDSLDLVVTGAEWGQGKRAGWLTSFTLACINRDGCFLDIGKVGTGIKEKEEGVSFEQLTNIIKPLIISQTGKEVKATPKLVLEIDYEEIQKSPTYSSGYALRFPRVIKIRDDKPPEEASSIEQVESLYLEQ